jgi:quercetin dioxygenase-like cupin family protein
MHENIIHIQRWNQSNQPTEEGLEQKILAEGLTPYRWSNTPGDAFAAHSHNYHKIIYVVMGSITFGFPVEGEPVTLFVGDRLDLPAGVRHNAVVGPEGVVCLEAHKGQV